MQKFLKSSLILSLFIFLTSCSESDDSNPSGNIGEEEISGSVILPEGSTLDLNDLSVQSYVGSSDIGSSGYSLNVIEESHNFIFVSDAHDKVILMGYNYPEQTDFGINAESTVIALAMSMPIASSLTDAAKVDFVNKLKQNSNYSSVVAKMENLINNGISPLDTNQDIFLKDFLSLFENTITSKSNKTIEDYDKNPVTINKVGNKITFVNGGKFYETSIGIYKDDKRLEYLELDRIQFFATSASEAFNTASNLVTTDLEGIELIEKTYEFKEDGQYEILIKTGSGSGISSERREALWDNMSKWSMDFFLAVVPLKGNKECAQHVLSEFRTYTTTFMEGKDINTLADALSTSYDISKSLVGNLGQGVECLSNNPEFLKFSKLVKALLSWDAWVARVGTAGNISFGIGQWLYDNSSMELCYQRNGDELTECSKETVIIGTQEWKVKNLAVTTYRNGDPIPEITGEWDWLSQTKGAMCYHNNYSENAASWGIIYNGYAANDPRGLCPEGFHVPSDAEWQILADFLGGEDVAGAKMKIPYYTWQDTNTDGNSSGFTAIPTPGRSYQGIYSGFRSSSSWWSSTEEVVVGGSKVFTRHVSSGSTELRRGESYNKTSGLYVRCLKD